MLRSLKSSLTKLTRSSSIVLVNKARPNADAPMNIEVRKIDEQVFELSVDTLQTVNWLTAIATLQETIGINNAIELLLCPSVAPLLTLPASQVALSKDEWQAYANHQFSQVLGDISAEFVIELESHYRKNRIATALPRRLVEFVKNKPQIHLVPLFQWAWNKSVYSIANQKTWALVSWAEEVQPLFVDENGSLNLLPATYVPDLSLKNVNELSERLLSLNSVNIDFDQQVWIEVCTKRRGSIEKYPGWHHEQLELIRK